MPDLHLNVKGVYFDEAKAGIKKYEYRLRSKWEKRLAGKTFGKIFVKKGYPCSDDADRIISRPWRGYEIQTITHPHFGPDPVEVCAILIN